MWVEVEDFRFGEGCNNILAFSGRLIIPLFPVVRLSRYITVGFSMADEGVCSGPQI